MIRAFLVNFSATLVATALSTAATLIIVRSLSPADWGTSASALGLGQLLGAGLSFGTQIERVRRYSAMATDQRQLVAKTDSHARIALATAVFLVGCLIATVATPAGVILVAAAGVYASLASTNFLIASKQFVRAGLVVSAEKLLLLVFVGTAVITNAEGQMTLPIGQGVAGLVVCIAAGLSIRGPGSGLTLKQHTARVRRQYSTGLFLGLTSLAPSLLLLDASIVLAVAGPEQAGSFALAARLVAPLTVATSALVAVLMPFLISPAGGSPTTTPHSLGVLIVIYFIVLGVLAATASFWVPAVFGSTYSSSVVPVQLYVANAFAVFFTRVLVTVGQARGDDKAMSELVGAQVVLALVGVGLGATLGGSTGAASSVVITNTLLSLALGLRTWGRKSKTAGATS